MCFASVHSYAILDDARCWPFAVGKQSRAMSIPIFGKTWRRSRTSKHSGFSRFTDRGLTAATSRPYAWPSVLAASILPNLCFSHELQLLCAGVLATHLHISSFLKSLFSRHGKVPNGKALLRSDSFGGANISLPVFY